MSLNRIVLKILGCIQTEEIIWSGPSPLNLVWIESCTLRLVCIQTPVKWTFLFRTKAHEQNQVSKDLCSHWPEIMRVRAL